MLCKVVFKKQLAFKKNEHLIGGVYRLSIFHLGEEEGVAGDGLAGGGTGSALGEGGDPGLFALAAAYLKEGTDHGTDHIP